MEIHSPDIYGPIELEGAPGTSGQVLTSTGAVTTPTWQTLNTIPGIFEFNSASATSHVIVHNLNSTQPLVTVYRTDTNEVVLPASITPTDANTLTITFGPSRAIKGTIVGI